MASPTRQTRLRRHRKRIKQGQSRKAQNRNKGTTKSPSELFADLPSNQSNQSNQ